MMRLFLTITAVIAATCLGALSQTPSPTPAEPLTARVDKLFVQWDKPNSPGCSLAVKQGPQIIYERSYGLASLELGVPLKPSSIFNVGSITKQFTAMSILM